MVRRRLDERGATITFALVLFLVCMAISSIVLAAATAAAGEYFEMGRYDKRYYSVMSAARVFRDSLCNKADDDDLDAAVSRTYTLKQRRQLKRSVRRTLDTEERVSSISDPEGCVVTFVNGEATELASGYDFLSYVTYYALVGKSLDSSVKNYSNTDPATNPITPNVELVVSSLESSLSSLKLPESTASVENYANTWLEPFSQGDWIGTGEGGYRELVFEIQPSDEMLDAGSLPVEVRARIRKDWTVDLQFSNKVSVGDTDRTQYFLTMTLVADINVDVDSNEQMSGSTHALDAETLINTYNVTQTRTTEIAWHLEREEPGKGFSS